MRNLIALSCVMTLTLVSIVGACPSDPDSSFAAGGIAVLDVQSVSTTNGVAVVEAPGGGAFVAGGHSVDGSIWRPAVIRYDEHGKLDEEFGDDGVAILDIDGAFHGIAIDGQGRILAAGTHTPDAPPGISFLVARFDSSGQPDPSFGDGGYTITAVGETHSEGRAITVLSDGRIVVVGSSLTVRDTTFYRPAAVAYEDDGTIDEEFGENGIATIEAPSYGLAVTRTENDAIVLTGYGGPDADHDIVVAKLDSSGQLAADFGTNGVRRFARKADEQSWDIQVDAGGSLYVLTNIRLDLYPVRSKVMVRRLLPNGSNDPSYGRGGRVSVRLRRNYTAAGLAVDADGAATVVAGTGPRQPVLVRFTSDGRRDAAFGNNGVLRLEHDDYLLARGIALQEDGKVLITGSTGGALFVMRVGSESEQCVSKAAGR